MSKPIRKWLKDLLQYGRRSVQSPGDGKSPLLWAADLPRLGQMWLGHCWFRTWLDLRQTPPRVVYDPQEVFSPDVRLVRPTALQPIQPLQQARQAWATFLAWLENGGLEQAIARLGRGLAGGIAGTLGLVVFGLIGLIGTLLAGIVGLFGASALGTLLGVDALGRRLQTLAGHTGRVLRSAYEGLGDGVTGFVSRFRNPRELLWTLATVTGTVGLILLMVLQAGGLPGTTNRATAADSHTVRRPMRQLAQTDSSDDLYNGLPDPFAPSETAPPQSEPPADDFNDPFGRSPVDLTEPPASADLEVDVVRTPLPPEIARFNHTDDTEEFFVESKAPTIDVLDLPADDWLTSLARNEVSRQPVVPAAYRESTVAPPAVVSLPEPIDSGDRFTPATRKIGVTIRKTQPEFTRPGELCWYDLIVTNHSDEPVAGLVVEERVAEPHRVAHAQPAASYRDGVLTWQLDGLAAGEETRLGVAVYPMSADAMISTTAAVRPIATFSAVTLVQPEAPRVEPVPAEPPAEELLIEEPPLVDELPIVEERPPEVPPAVAGFRRIKIVMTTPDRVRDGASCVIRFDVSNTGTAALSGVVVRGLLPASLQHRHGDSIESTLGPLAPGETKHVELHAKAAATGEAEMLAEVSAAEGVATTVRGSFDIVERLPALSATDDFRPAIDHR